MPSISRLRHRPGLWSIQILLLLLFFVPCLSAQKGTLSSQSWAALQADTSDLFWHGFNGYMTYAFPEDELRPVTCAAFTRDFQDQDSHEINDPLGNYSLTLVDTLSTLAILASSSESRQKRRHASDQFKQGIQTVVRLYGDGSNGDRGVGERARGFDLDSKVQVFETAIRGLGGLLSAHLFAVGELPMRDYDPAKLRSTGWTKSAGIQWSRNFTYDGQLLRLAHDLGRRLLPAFTTSTGIPYPRVNLRHGIPFYRNAPQNCEADPPEDGFGEASQCPATPTDQDERTETCSAGAGSLVLEFTVLSRLTGDQRFEKLAKKAFWAVWDRRLGTGLVGAGIDAETGEWKGSPSTGIGAGIDSFYEYAAKSYILLAGTTPTTAIISNDTWDSNFEPAPLSKFQDSSEGFLYAWQESQKAIRRHVYNDDNVVHPYYMQVNHWNGAQSAAWIDSLSAFYPGTLALAGHVEEAETAHLLYTALWSRYSAIPERWSTTSGDIEHELPWWPGRPEFIESAWYLYRATEDPWYVHVGEMTLRDIRRRCWTPCGWSGLQDVRSGKLNDRMESFFLGETAKYLHLLFDPEHPLNSLDAPWVFTTEGHPLIIPQANRGSSKLQKRSRVRSKTPDAPTCPAASKSLPLTVSKVAARSDLFHAAALAQLHFWTPVIQRDAAYMEASHPSVDISDMRSPTNNMFYPWTLPQTLVPPNGTCAPIFETPTFHITFPTSTTLAANAMNHRTMRGIFMNNLAGVKLSLIQDVSGLGDELDGFRLNAINGQHIGRDEQVFIAKDVISSVVTDNDPNFARIRDPVTLDIVFDLPRPTATAAPTARPTNGSAEMYANLVDSMEAKIQEMGPERQDALLEQLKAQGFNDRPISSALEYIKEMISSKFTMPTAEAAAEPPFTRYWHQAITAFGAGAAPLPHVADAPGPESEASGIPKGDLIWKDIYHASELCDSKLDISIARTHQVLVLQRGGCSFSDKLENIPAFPPSRESLKVIVVVNYPDERKFGDASAQGLSQEQLDTADFLFRPLLDKPQVTSGGLARRNPVPLIMVGGGEEVYEKLRDATSMGLRRRYSVHAQGVPIRNLHVL